MKNTNALIVGLGSIGRKHFLILKKLNFFKKIYTLTRQKRHKVNKVKNLKKIDLIKPSYVIISSRTNTHFSHLKFFEKKIKNATVLVEKPLFEKYRNFKIKNNNVFVGYNLRFHPVIVFLKKFLKNKKIFSINLVCKSFLPEWRKNIIYSKSNSAKKSFGGGALLELSHELDYFQWIFGKIKSIEFSKLNKNSNLKIDCEDSVLVVGKTNDANFFLDLNFLSHRSERSILIEGDNFNVKADLLKYKIEISRKNKLKTIKFRKIKDQTYIDQHRAIIKKNFKNLCSYPEGLDVLKVIKIIRKKNI